MDCAQKSWAECFMPSLRSPWTEARPPVPVAPVFPPSPLFLTKAAVWILASGLL